MSTTPMPTSFTTVVFRYSNDPAAMTAFLTDLGLAVAISSESGYAELHAGIGRVLVHPTQTAAASGPPSGLTCLNLGVEQIDTAATWLEAQGFPVRTWDEAYGHQGSLTSPGDVEITLTEDQTDLYGYQAHDTSNLDQRLGVTAVRACFDRRADMAFFERLGFVPDAGGDQWWQAMRGPGTAGVIGLHTPDQGDQAGWDTDSEFGRVARVRLGFETSEPLDELAARLCDLGHDAKVVVDAARSVHLTDPDGQHLEIHPRP